MAAKKPAARIVKSLDTLRSQVNKFAPKRSKISDGWLGDAKHSMRKSDHNPEPDGTVDALDITHNPENGVDIQKIADAIVKSKDRRVSYLICKGKIVNSQKTKDSPAWVWRKYNGANGHYHHLHVSVLDAHQDDTTPWDIAAAFGQTAAPAPKPAPAAKPKPEVVDIYDGKKHAEVEAVQQRLNDLGYPEVGKIDGEWGSKTRAALLAFRADNDLPLEPVIDSKLLAALMTAKPRVIAPERANATLSDLRKEGAADLAAADKTDITGYALTGVGALGGAAKATEALEGYGGIVKRIADTVEPIKGFVADNFWLLAIAAGVLVVWQTGILKRIRLDKHQKAEDVSL